MREWKLTHEKVLVIITDNGANIVKAVKIMNEKAEFEQNQQTEANGLVNDVEPEGDGDIGESNASDEDEEDIDSDGSADEITDEDELTEVLEDDGILNDFDNESEDMDMNDDFTDQETFYQRMKCMAHTLQLVIKKAYTHYDSLIIKARRLVSIVRRSGPAVEKLSASTGKFLITDNSTRWNSTYRMIRRLLQVKNQLNDVLMGMQIDSLLIAEWSKLEELSTLFEPFCTQTDILQSNTMSLSYAIPSLRDLHYHLLGSPYAKSLTKSMIDDIRNRFDFILNPQSQDFLAIPAASCLLHPHLVKVLMTPDMQPLFDAAKGYIVSQVCYCHMLCFSTSKSHCNLLYWF
jgi:hypothetical protein